ncbi:Lrp/AsnC family transcriptional regulator [Rathayibacter soli]|uniref:Lrp/AsnC family transcriptional regulator n=1 Tax=Rathayibacter soli TaxID=3144168 RepID=UPI0027E592EF|nr:Lrp/AsnC family transcriptional regulator [Glaciibacter superstes]
MVDLSDMDDIDRDIVAVLQVDGRRSYAEIAKQLGIPASSVRYRTKRLEDAGILQVVGIANPLAIGFHRLAMIGLRTTAGQSKAVCDALSAFPETSYVVLTTGRYDVLAEVICRDIAHFVEVVNDRMQAIEGVVSTESFFVLEVHKLAYGWGVGSVQGSGGSTEPARVAGPF